MRTLAIAALVGQAAIAVTGSVVRVTGSGLGCPAWPSCFAGSLVPNPRYDVALLHQWVEFGNRILAGVLTVVVIACFVGALATRPRRRELTLLAASMPAGVVLQAVVGGITVLAGLAWWTVVVHFLISMVLVWLAVMLVHATEPPTGASVPVLPRAARGLLGVIITVLGLLLVAGTLVTSAGPHAGDAKTPRLALPVAALAQFHADLVVGLIGLLVGFGFLMHAVGASGRVRRHFWALVLVVLAQGALGATQYALGVPDVLVAFHVLGAALVTTATAALWAATSPEASLPAAAIRTASEGQKVARPRR
jgi:cytochrome c oxidase assembly protein subunit 15